MPQIVLGGLAVDITFKDIKNVHLSVHPPAGRVSVAAPERMSLDSIRLFAIMKLGWIRQQNKLRSQARETSRDYLDRESHFLWGKRYLLKVLEDQNAFRVDLQHSRLVLSVPSTASTAKRHEVVASWYRSMLMIEASDLVMKWSPILGVSVNNIYVQTMKTKWGSCSPGSRSIRLNTELAKKPKECVEYVAVHEMMHLIEPRHNTQFIRSMNRVLPKWRLLRDQLNELPVAYDGLRR